MRVKEKEFRAAFKIEHKKDAFIKKYLNFENLSFDFSTNIDKDENEETYRISVCCFSRSSLILAISSRIACNSSSFF